MSTINLIHGLDVVPVGMVKLKILCQFFDAKKKQLDISSASELKLRIQKPDGTSLDAVLVLDTNGKNGEAYYLTVSGDLAQEGFYKAQGWVKFPAGIEAWSLPIEFRTSANLPAPVP